MPFNSMASKQSTTDPISSLNLTSSTLAADPDFDTNVTPIINLQQVMETAQTSEVTVVATDATVITRFLSVLSCLSHSTAVTSGFIYTCLLGHVSCPSCEEEFRICTICRQARQKDSSIFRNQALERARELILEDYVAPCEMKYLGCKHESRCNSPAQRRHMETCMYKVTSCGSRANNSCTWAGSKTNVLTHVLGKGCGILLPARADKTFVTPYQYRIPVASKAFPSDKEIYWKPVYLHHLAYGTLLPYVVVTHTTNGMWLIRVRAHATKLVRAQFTVTLGVFAANVDMNTQHQPLPQYSYTGPFSPSRGDNGWENTNDCCLILNTIQVQSLANHVDEKKLFSIKTQIQGR